jgi:ATP-dependent helicase/nuclease subunit B
LKAPSVYTISASAHFAEDLARGLLRRIGDDPLALSSATIYLPTQRAARTFGDAFAKVMGGAALLPQFKPLGDSTEEDLLFEASVEGLETLPAIAPLPRQLLLAQLVREWDRQGRDGTLSFAQSAVLADSLSKVMDEVETQGVDLGKLKDLLPPEMAEHWEGVTRFLDVLHDAWPKLLAAENKLTPATRRVLALKALGARLQAAPPDGWTIAAGSTGSIPATAQLLGVIARLPRGAVVLPGLDQRLDEESWQRLEDDPGHPQYGLRELLRSMKTERGDVKDWFAAAPNPAREQLLRETLRPAPTTDAWRALTQKGSEEIAQGLNDIALVTAADPAQEALAIALALREALETPGRSAALVTPDRNLARRVAAEMRRWGVEIDDSAGRPLAHTTAGAFLCLLAEAAENGFAPVPLLALLKHPFARCGQDSASFRARARELDRWCLRGPRPDPGLAGIRKAIGKAALDRNPPPPAVLNALAAWWDDIAAILSPLEDIYARADVTLDELLDRHVTAAEALACDHDKTCILWNNSDGVAAAELLEALRLACEGLPPVEPASWPALLRGLAMKIPVRSAFGRHPRLHILGPLEARLQHFDLTILGGLNEGSWPQAASADPWFSRPMRKSLGLEQPERGIGLSAHDFAMLAAGPCVLMTRAMKADGAPTLASRWLQRLEQLTRGLKLDARLHPAHDYADLAARMMELERLPPLKRPAPRPPVETRPRRLSVTEIETWLRDPYAIYAKHVLKLRPLESLDEPVGPLVRGTALHKAMEEFIKQHPGELPDDAAARLGAIADRVFEEAGIPKAALAVWRPRFQGAAQGFIAVERERRGDIERSYVETYGKRTFDAPGGDFVLSGQADRIDIRNDGKAAILDYKTGATPTRPQVEELLAPQLPLEAAILAEGGFPEIGKRLTEELIYLSLADGKKAAKPVQIDNAQALAVEAAEKLAQRIARFDDKDTPYLSRVRPYRTDSVGDYDHLARVREWSVSGGEES